MDSGEFMVIVAAVWRLCLVGFWWVLRCVVLFRIRYLQMHRATLIDRLCSIQPRKLFVRRWMSHSWALGLCWVWRERRL